MNIQQHLTAIILQEISINKQQWQTDLGFQLEYRCKMIEEAQKLIKKKYKRQSIIDKLLQQRIDEINSETRRMEDKIKLMNDLYDKVLHNKITFMDFISLYDEHHITLHINLNPHFIKNNPIHDEVERDIKSVIRGGKIDELLS